MTGLLCPACGNDKLVVRDSRPQPCGVRRRRVCECGHRFTTIETVIADAPIVIEQVPVQGGFALRSTSLADYKARLLEAVARVLECP